MSICVLNPKLVTLIMNKLAGNFALKTAQNLSEMFPELVVRYEILNNNIVQYFEQIKSNRNKLQ